MYGPRSHSTLTEYSAWKVGINADYVFKEYDAILPFDFIFLHFAEVKWLFQPETKKKTMFTWTLTLDFLKHVSF